MKGWQSKTDGVVQSNPHIIIEGENLEVLKQLQGAYYEQIKCIYIDPPYNTGKDFVYSDNFTQGKQAYWQESGQTDEYGVKITTNTESSGRYHSDWLSMIYSRLLLSRQLLTDDGVIFVSIDDNEVHNLRKVMDEVFGEENFISSITRESIKGGSVSKNLRNVHDYVLVYSKNITETELGGEIQNGIVLDKNDENGLFAKGRELNKWGAGSRREDSPSMWYPVTINTGEVVYPIRNDGTEGRWRLGKTKMNIVIENNDYLAEKRGDGTYILYEKIRDDSPRIKQFTSIFKDNYINAKGSESIKSIFNISMSYFDYAKPVELVKDLIKMADTSNNDIILDFFAGSGTTGQAVMELNQADGGNRQCILVQMPELTDEKSEAYKAGYKRISDITIERNKRAIQGYGKTPKALSAGFEVFRLEQSNFPVNQWRPDPELDDDQNVVEFEKYVLAKEAGLFSELDGAKAILEIAIKEGLKLDYVQTRMKDFATNQVLQLSDDSRTILVCVDPKIEISTVELLGKNYKESKFICLERAIDTTTKWNLNHNLGAGFKAI